MLFPKPESPLAAKNTTLLFVKYLSHLRSWLTSASPKLMLTTPPPFCATNLAASLIAAQVGSVAHPVWHSTDSTRKSLACGAIACDHSMSSASSTIQPLYTGGLVFPGQVTVKLACGIPNRV